MKRFFSLSSMISLIESARSSDRWLLRIGLLAVVVAAVWLILTVNSLFSVADIRSGGSLTEGMVGTPRFVNPALALTRADGDVTALIYSGLLTIDGNGELAPDLADGWTISEDGTIYTIVMRQDATFHDGTPVTSEDVRFTIDLIKNNDLKSPLRSNWSGATVAIVDNHTLEITLEEPYAPFIQNLRVGILPAHIWRDVPIEQVPFSTHNTTPIGSGPYKIIDTTFSKNGTVSEYQLERHNSYTPTPHLSELTLRFFADETTLIDAWDKGDIMSSAYLPPTTVSALNQEQVTVKEVPLTRSFGVFFNQNRSVVLRDAAVREVLELVLDREQLVTAGLAGAGIPTATAVQTATSAVESEDFHAELGSSTDTALDIAITVLEDAGWNQLDDGTWEKDIDGDVTPLSFTVRTVNTPVFESTLTAIVAAWESLGVTVATEQFNQSDLVQSVIRDRDFDALLFGIDPGQTEDVYPFWHSSQQDDPGLNVAQYANLTVDEALEELRLTNDAETHQAALATVNTIIQEERPAIFLFRPTVQYVTPIELESVLAPTFSQPADRFTSIAAWHTEERMLWPFFTNETDTESEQPLDTTE